MDEDLREAARQEARREYARRSLGEYGSLLLGDYQRPRHVRLLCDYLEALERRDINRLAVEMPPRHSKSTHVSQLFPAWYLGRNPTHDVALASYGAELAQKHSRRARGLLADPRSPFDVSVAADSSAVDRWATTAGGGVRATGVRGGLTGHGAHALIVDDPVKDRDEADSLAVRDATWAWWTETALTRLMPGGVVCVTGTRWSDDDLLGRILNGPSAGEWTVLELPALADVNDPLGRAEGQALWPEWFDERYLEELRVELGPRAFYALYQQRPTPQGGATFKREWLQGRYAELPEGVAVVTAVDASFGKGVGSGDYSALVTLAADGQYFYVVDACRGRWPFHRLVEEIKRVASEFTPTAVLVEDAAAGQSAIQELRRASSLPIVPVRPQGSKVARAEGVSGLAEAGRVLFPRQAPRWRDELLEELTSFPSGRHDDLVDAFVYALRRLRERGQSNGGGVVGVLYYDQHGNLVSDDGEAVPYDHEFSAVEVYRRVGHRDPLAGGPGEFEELDDEEPALVS